jgi:hypothetical protein
MPTRACLWKLCSCWSLAALVALGMASPLAAPQPRLLRKLGAPHTVFTPTGRNSIAQGKRSAALGTTTCLEA